MPLLFSYGSLQRTEVQLATFGRALAGVPDELLGFALVLPEDSGSPHANVVPADAAHRVRGMAFDVTDAELAAADEYERRDGYARVKAPLSSGRTTWVYIDSASKGGRMEQRNPYAAPKTPLFTDNSSKALPTESDVMEYGGFWRRLGAVLLDALILSPLALAQMLMLGDTHLAYVYYALPGLAITLVFHVYLVQRFGGTPGKRILGMRIANLDGTPVTTRTAFIRYSPLFALAVLSTISTALMSRSLGADGLEGLSYMEKMMALNGHQSIWAKVVGWIMQAWYIVGAITLAANSRKRAVHDFIAGTVVLQD
jgi:uncharacterized RDD family membrane protein YckC